MGNLYILYLPYFCIWWLGIPAKGWKQISLHEDRFWKLLEIKARLKARTWDELVDKLYDLVMKYEAN